MFLLSTRIIFSENKFKAEYFFLIKNTNIFREIELNLKKNVQHDNII